MTNTIPTGSIEVVCGSMFSGKTEELMRRLKRAQYGRQKIQVFNPKIDNRFSEDHVQSHDSNRVPSVSVCSALEILALIRDDTRVVGIDEAQFFDADIVEVCNKLANRGVRVICAGLDMDFRGDPFGPMPRLLSIAESITKLQAICVVCGQAASRSQKMSGEAVAIEIGAKEMYEARCRHCHDPELRSKKRAVRRTSF